jgi:hypothetical protein
MSSAKWLKLVFGDRDCACERSRTRLPGRLCHWQIPVRIPPSGKKSRLTDAISRRISDARSELFEGFWIAKPPGRRIDDLRCSNPIQGVTHAEGSSSKGRSYANGRA